MNEICILLSTYNGEKYIKELLNSVLNQSVNNYKTLVRDDGSIDHTQELLNEFKSNFPDVIFSIKDNKGNLGPRDSFFELLKHADGNYFLYCDQDDIWVKDKAQKLLSLLHKEDCYVVFSDAKLTDERLNELGLNMFDVVNFTKIDRKLFYRNYHGTRLLLTRFIITGATMAMRKSKICDFFPIPESPFFIHDSWIATLAKCMGKVYFIDEALILYRQHNKQSIGAYNNRNATKMSYTNKNELLSIINSKHVREKVVLDFFRNKKTLLSNDQMKFLEMRQMLYVKLLNRPNSIIQRIKCIDPRLYFFKMPEFYTIRMFAGNCCKYIFG